MKIKCLNCGSDKLIHYEEETITKERKINKDGSISKIERVALEGVAGAYGVMCLDCAGLFNYELDNKDRIVELFHRETRFHI